MDGNRRWAREHKLQILKGHEFVAFERIQALVEFAIASGLSHLTLWAFSTENWNRERQEVDGILALFRRAFSKSAAELHEKGVKLKMIGDLKRFPADIQENVAKWLAISENNSTITVTFALNYGGRDEIIRAIHAWQATNPEQSLTEEAFSQYLDTAGMPDPDLIIRTGGETRTSGFLPFQSAYAEWYFTSVLMPDFTPEEFAKALDDFAKRQRRFGK